MGFVSHFQIYACMKMIFSGKIKENSESQNNEKYSKENTDYTPLMGYSGFGTEETLPYDQRRNTDFFSLRKFVQN
jgi:hypothetical protein